MSGRLLELPREGRCGRHLSKGSPCGRRARVYAAGMWRCDAHLPAPSTTCSHSIAPDGWCAWCGTEVRP